MLTFFVVEYAVLTRKVVTTAGATVEFRMLSDKEIDDLVARTDLQTDKDDDKKPTSSAATEDRDDWKSKILN